MNLTGRKTVAVIVPLFGYWNDIKDNPVNGEVLSASLRRVYSNVHNLLLIFVANPQTLPSDPQDPESVTNILLSRSRAGNVSHIPVERSASYTEYIRQGMEYALTETEASFMVVLNPWVLIQDGGIDALVDRANRGDDANVVSGFNVRNVIGGDLNFDRYSTPVPKEDWDINLDFLVMPRFAAEMASFDPGYMTKQFLEVDIFQNMRSKGFGVISSQQIPIFTFDFPWVDYESNELFEADRTYFIKKWGFDPSITYEEKHQTYLKGNA